jgi:putative DNA primase/helicase
LAHLVQKPGIVPGVAILLKSIPGVGKDLFMRMFADKILGRNYYLNTSTIDDIIGTFPKTAEKMLITLNEASGRDTFLADGCLKDCITRVRETVNEKHIKKYEINACARYMFFSNNDTPLKIELGDRRFQVFECDGEMANNREYFNALVSEMENEEVMRAFYQFLMTRDISKWNAIADRVKTELFTELQQVNVPIIYRFLDDYLRSVECDTEFEVSSKDIYKMFKDWCVETNMGVKGGVCNISTTKFGRDLSKVTGVVKTRHRTMGILYTITPEIVRENSPLED